MPSRLSLVVPPLVQLGGGSNKRLSATEWPPQRSARGRVATVAKRQTGWQCRMLVEPQIRYRQVQILADSQILPPVPWRRPPRYPVRTWWIQFTGSALSLNSDNWEHAGVS